MVLVLSRQPFIRSLPSITLPVSPSLLPLLALNVSLSAVGTIRRKAYRMQGMFGAGMIGQCSHRSHTLKHRGVGSTNGKVRCLGHGDVLFPHDVIVFFSKYREVKKYMYHIERYTCSTLMNCLSVKCVTCQKPKTTRSGSHHQMLVVRVFYK